MKKTFILVASVLVVGLNASYGQCNPPVINSFSPNTGFIGSTVTITGANFSAIPADNQVFFGATQATVQTASFGVLTITVPVGATAAPISVKNACNLTGYSRTAFNGIFCPTPITSTTYQNSAFTLGGPCTPTAYPGCGATVTGAYNMISQDLDGDGKPDVITNGQTSNTTVARNTSTPGNLSFTAHTFASGGSSVAVADFDGDGKRDILTIGRILRNTSTGAGNINFTSVNTPNAGYQTAAGDFNNDGKIDIVSGNGGALNFYRNTSTGTGVISFSALAYTQNVLHNSTGIQVVDVDGDGKVDVLASQGNGNRAVSLRNTTAANATAFSFEAYEAWPSNGIFPYRCQIADFDKDGKIDLTTPNYGNGGPANTAIFRNTSIVGNISFAPTVNLTAPINNYRIGVGDVNGDGLPDIVTKSLAVNVFSVYPNISSGPGNIAFSTRFDYSSSHQAEVSGIVIGDLDGDYVPDIATSGTVSQRIKFHRNTSAQVDNAPPTAACKNIIVPLSQTGTATVTAAMIDNGSSDACGLAPLKINGVASVNFTCADIGPNNVTLTVTDQGNNVTTCSAVVTVAPAAIVVSGQTTVCQGQTVALSANAGDSYQWHKDGVDIAGATSQTYTATTTGAYTVAVTNAGGCSGTSAATNVTVNNNPTVSTTPSGVAFLCPPSGTATIAATTSSIYQWKLNGTNIANATQQSYTAAAAGTYSVQVIDLFGCSATSDPIVVSASAPEVGVTGNLIAINDGDNSPSLLDGTDFGTTFPSTPVAKTFVIENTGTNALTVSGISVTGADAGNFAVSGMTFPTTIATASSASFDVTFTGTSIANYSATVTVANNDCDEPAYDFAINADISCVFPSFAVCPGAQSANTDAGLCSALVNYSATVAGIPAPAVSYTLSGATTGSGTGTGSGEAFNKGTTTVTITASNGCGPDDVCTFTVEVTDNEAPVFTAPQNTTMVLNNSSAFLVPDLTAGLAGTDNCGTVTFAQAPIAGISVASSENASTTVTIMATDGNGNNTVHTVTLTADDQTPPVAPVLADAAGECSVIVTAPTATDNSAGSITGTTTDPLMYTAQGTYTITWTFDDGNGNITTAMQNVVVDDITAPVPALATLPTITGECLAAATAPTATDNCTGMITATTTDATSYSAQGTYNVTWTYNDGNGQSITQSQTIVVDDVTDPVISCPAAVTHTADAGMCGYTFTPASATATDNCTANVSITGTRSDNQPLSASYPVGTTTITWTANDGNGNNANCTQTVTVTDNQHPVAICKPYTLNLANGVGTLTGTDINNGSTDNCGIASLTPSQTAFTCADAGTKSITLTVTDVHGNSSTCMAQVTVLQQPVCAIAVTPSNTTYTGGVATNLYLGYGPQSATLTANATGGAGFTYLWSGLAGLSCTSCQNPEFTPAVPGLYTFTVTATNGNGCATTCSKTFCVKDIREFKKGSPSGKVLLCHVPPGNPANAHTLSISTSAVTSHLGNHAGDELGSCGQTCGAQQMRSIAGNDEGVGELIIDEELEMVVFPNPTSTEFHLLIESISTDAADVMVYDLSGRIVERAPATRTNTEVVLGSNLTPGVYFVEVRHGDLSKKIKVVKL